MTNDDSRWFDALGTCCGCGKPATGKVMNSRNQSMGNYCRPCAEKRIDKAQRERDNIFKVKRKLL